MSSPSTGARSDRSVIAFLAFTGILLAFGIDSSLPAFDDLRGAFGLEPDSSRITLIVTWYFAGTAVGQLFYGPISDRFGRMPALRLGIGVYCLGAIGSILAPSIGWLFVSRFVWGFGAASPGMIRAAITRDLYQGDQMARVISIYMAVFLIGPIFAPAAGQGILALGSWEWVFTAALVLAAALFVWTFIFGETLDESNQRPIKLGTTLAGFKKVFTTRSTLGYTLALTFSFGGFIVFLGSAQPIIDVIYDRESEFTLWFGLAGAVMALYFVAVNRFIERHGAHRVSMFVALAGLVFSATLLIAALASDGVPTFFVWLILVAVANAFITMLTPTCYALGLRPMGELAGTASAVMGFVSTLGGSALAALVNAQIDGTVTPMAVGYVVYGSIAVGFLVWAGGGADDGPTTLRQSRFRPGRVRP